jgi:hypothetical protein
VTREDCRLITVDDVCIEPDVVQIAVGGYCDQNDETVQNLQTVHLLWIRVGCEQVVTAAAQGHASQQTETTSAAAQHQKVDQRGQSHDTEKGAQNQSVRFIIATRT